MRLLDKKMERERGGEKGERDAVRASKRKKGRVTDISESGWQRKGERLCKCVTEKRERDRERVKRL